MLGTTQRFLREGARGGGGRREEGNCTKQSLAYCCEVLSRLFLLCLIFALYVSLVPRVLLSSVCIKVNPYLCGQVFKFYYLLK